MPSVWEDVAPLVAIEQMMRGKLVIASDIGGLGEEVADAGIVFPAGDVAALANCMSHVIEMPETALDLGRAARLRALDLFNSDRMVERHVSIYRNVMQS
jgi:glycosyltransferase involved in cell wall biosynthesis